MLPGQVPVFAALLFLLALSVTAAIFETGLLKGLERNPTALAPALTENYAVLRQVPEAEQNTVRRFALRRTRAAFISLSASFTRKHQTGLEPRKSFVPRPSFSPAMQSRLTVSAILCLRLAS